MKYGQLQEVEHLSLVLTYPDGGAAEFSGSGLIADIRVEMPDYPPLDAQDIIPYAIPSPQVKKLTIEVTLTLDGRLNIQVRPPPGGAT